MCASPQQDGDWMANLEVTIIIHPNCKWSLLLGIICVLGSHQQNGEGIHGILPLSSITKTYSVFGELSLPIS